jgi:integrase
VYEFYTYHSNTGAMPDLPLYRFVSLPRRRYKDFLYHKTKSAPVATRVVAVLKPEPEKYLPKTLTPQEVQWLVAACRHMRDRFLVGLLFESGMRIGQALGLRHTDVRSWDNEIDIVPREDNANGARAKTRERYTVVVPRQVMDLYTRYVLDELAPLSEQSGTLPDYVFVNLWDGQIGRPLTYPTARAFLQRLSRRVLKDHGVDLGVRAHVLRHTYATERIRAGVPLAVVQKQLGHASIVTTVQTYTHLTTKDVKVALQAASAGGVASVRDGAP